MFVVAFTFKYLAPPSDVCMVTTFFVSNPRSNRYSATKERINSAEATSRITARAVSLTTNAARDLFCCRFCCRLVVADLPLLSFEEGVEVRSRSVKRRE